MEATPVHTLNLTGVLSESKRIIKAKYSHFLALSLLFLPLAFSIVIYPTLLLSGHFATADHLHKFSPNIHLLYIIIIYVLSLCAIATTTYTTYHSFTGNSVTLSTAFRSLTLTFFPILSTAIVAHLLLFLISLTFLLFAGVIITIAQTLGLTIDYNSIHFTLFSTVVGAMYIVITIYLLVNWSLAFAIVVTESKWGFAPLIRSSYLVNGMRSVSLFVMLYFGVFGALFVLMNTYNMYIYIEKPHATVSWVIVLFSMLVVFCLMMLMLRTVVADTVLYMYCKALHGELAIDIDHGFAHEYVNLRFDDQKAPLIVSIIAAS